MTLEIQTEQGSRITMQDEEYLSTGLLAKFLGIGEPLIRDTVRQQNISAVQGKQFVSDKPPSLKLQVKDLPRLFAGLSDALSRDPDAPLFAGAVDTSRDFRILLPDGRSHLVYSYPSEDSALD